MIVKVKEPIPEEYKFLRDDLTVFAYLHLAGDPENAKKLIDTGVTGIAYETVTSSDGSMPLLAPMSTIAGQLAFVVGSLKYFQSGIAIRATAEDQSTAYSMGISVPKVFAGAWWLASITGAMAGVILATRNGISPTLGLFGFSVLAIVLMAGLDSYIGVLIASLSVGVLEAMAQWKLGGDWAEVTPYIAVLIVILIRPYGLMGQEEVERI